MLKLLLVFCTLYSFSTLAIVIRHDVDDLDYRALAQPYADSVAYMDNCVAAVLSDYWLVTAAHCVSPSQDYPVKITFRDQAYPVANTFTHPDFGEHHDIALLKLNWPLENAKPSKLYSTQDEKGKPVVFIGNGKTGTGLTGESVRDRHIRAATNTVKDTEPYWLTFNFHAPGDSLATRLEGVSGTYDSGGPAFLNQDEQLFIVGVGCCQEPAFNEGKLIQGGYGAIEYYSRISTHKDWIERTIANNSAANQTATRAQVVGDTSQSQQRLLEHFYRHSAAQTQALLQHSPHMQQLQLRGLPLTVYAYQQGNAALFKVLFDLDIAPEHKGFMNQDYLALLTWQYHQQDYAELLDFLLARGFDINRQDSRGDAAIHLAGFYGDPQRLQQVIKRGAKVNLADNKGNTVLLDMVRKDRADLIRLLIDAGADPHQTNLEGISPLQQAKNMDAKHLVALMQASQIE